MASGRIFQPGVGTHTPVHAIWLNQIEIYFSIVQRKALVSNDFSSLQDVEDRLLASSATIKPSPPLRMEIHQD
jgi:hypothetical protein